MCAKCKFCRLRPKFDWLSLRFNDVDSKIKSYWKLNSFTCEWNNIIYILGMNRYIRYIGEKNVVKNGVLSTCFASSHFFYCTNKKKSH